MSEPFTSQIVMFGGNFAPRSWALCDGQLLAISQNQALFSLLGTTYGGDGRTTYGLPGMRGRVAIHSSNGSAGPGLSSYRLGSKGGTETTTLTPINLPSHTHVATAKINASSSNAATNVITPEGNYLAGDTTGEFTYANAKGSGDLAADSLAVTVGNTGGSRSFNNEAPYQVVNYIIQMYGIYPSRN